MFKKQKIIFTLLLLQISVLLMGCWDKIEIEERAYAMTVGIDVNVLESDDPLYVTFVIPNPAAIDGQSDEHNIIIAGTGSSLYSIKRRFSTRSSKELYLGHLKAVLIGEEIARQPDLLREIFDALEKDPYISRKVRIAIVEGTAKALLEVEPSIEPNISKYIMEIFSGAHRTNHAPLQDLNEIFRFLHRNGNGVITKISPGNEDLKASGAAVFKNLEFVGWIGPEINRGLMFLRDKIDMGGYNVEYKGNKVPIEITHSKTKYHLVEEDDDFKIIVDVTLEGDVRQFYFNPEEDILSSDLLGELELLYKSIILENINGTLSILQNEYGVDVVGFDQYIQKFHPKLWREIKEDYEDIFPQLDIVVNVDASIRRVGLSK